MNEKLYIADVAREIDRSGSTVRSWCRLNRLPRELRPQRDTDNGWRYWTPKQVEGIRRWMLDSQMHPGGGLSNFRPTPEQQEELLTKLRRRRSA